MYAIFCLLSSFQFSTFSTFFSSCSAFSPSFLLFLLYSYSFFFIPTLSSLFLFFLLYSFFFLFIPSFSSLFLLFPIHSFFFLFIPYFSSSFLIFLLYSFSFLSIPSFSSLFLLFLVLLLLLSLPFHLLAVFTIRFGSVVVQGNELYLVHQIMNSIQFNDWKILSNQTNSVKQRRR